MRKKFLIEITRPNYIILIVEVLKDMNSIRRSLVGEDKGSPKFLDDIKKLAEKKLKKKFEVHFLIPIHYSIIRKPVSIYIEGEDRPRVSRKGVGAMQLYEYIGSSDDLNTIMDLIDEYFKRKIDELKKKSSNNWLAAVTDFKIILGKNYTEI